MYKVESVEINQFWHRFDARCDFNEDVNIIIGRNGTGKTTFMNILHSILTVDLIGLADNDFETAKITLKNGNKRKTITVTKLEDMDSPFPLAEYQISRKKRILRLISIEDRRISNVLRRRILEESSEIRNELFSLVAVSSLSVYRLRNDDEYEVRDRNGSVLLTPVDYRLSQALAGLTQFQLELAEQAQEVSKILQKKVLASVLYSDDDTKQVGWELSFDKDAEQARLVSAYEQLGAIDNDVRKKIRFHVSAIDETIDKIKSKVDNNNIDIKSLEALRKTRKIIELSLNSKEETQKIYSTINQFLKIIKEFINDKNFSFNSGKLIISNDKEIIEHNKLSSGEKQLIILMVEALLQKGGRHIFLADEPELSLHIAWQRKIVPAIRQINPEAQIIVATHSPEVASKFKDSIFDMERVING